jgi:hypothetical protein
MNANDRRSWATRKGRGTNGSIHDIRGVCDESGDAAPWPSARGDDPRDANEPLSGDRPRHDAVMAPASRLVTAGRIVRTTCSGSLPTWKCVRSAVRAALRLHRPRGCLARSSTQSPVVIRQEGRFAVCA